MSESRKRPNFLGLEGSSCDPDTSPVVVLPVPFERTTSYGSGTAQGPEAILEASHQVELYDEELGFEPWQPGIATLSPIEDRGHSTQGFLKLLRSRVQGCLEGGKFVLSLGGEHTLTPAPVAAAAAVHGEIGVVQFDAHADLRDSYEGTPLSHACALRRVHDLGAPCLGVGIRSLSAGEAKFVDQHRLPMIWAWQLDRQAVDRLRSLLQAMPPKIYLTFDVDFLDPSLMPATGTPEPGGGFWWPTLALLRVLFEEKEVVAMDVVELAPIPGQPSSDFTAARLAYKCLAYRQQTRKQQRESTR